MKTEIKQRIEKIKVGQVPEGYKKTKIGIVPKEWEIHKLSEHLTESRILGSNGAAAKKITVKLWNKGVFEKQELHEGSANTTYYKRKSGQFVYSKLDFLNCAFGIIPKHLDGYESTQDLPCFDVDGVDTYYLLTYVTQRNFYTHFGMIADGGRKARRVGTKDMMSFPLAYPPLAEQKKIAKILSAQDKLIELQQKKIEELQKLKKVYLNKMFPKKGENVPEWRFKGFTDAWEQRKFDEVFDCTVQNNTLSRVELSYDEGTVLNVHYGDVLIKYGSVLDVQKDDIPRIPHSCRENFNGALLQDGDVIIADTAEDETTGKACEIGNLQGSAIVSGLHTMVCRPRNRMALGYLGYYLNSNAYHHQLLPLMQGIKVLSLSRSNIQKTSVSYPIAVKEQQLIAYYFSQLDRLITLHQRKLEEMKKQKKSLMQLLLTGIVRCKW